MPLEIVHRAAPCRNVPVAFTLDLTMALCPNCSEKVLIASTACPNCGANFDGVQAWKPVAESEDERSTMRKRGIHDPVQGQASNLMRSLAWAIGAVLLSYVPLIQMAVIFYSAPLLIVGIDLMKTGVDAEYTFAYVLIRSGKAVIGLFVYSFLVRYAYLKCGEWARKSMKPTHSKPSGDSAQ